MKSRIAFTLISTLALTAGACGGDLSDKVKDWKSAACACKDKECAEKQGKAFVKLVKDNMDKKPSKDVAKKIDKLADEGQECLKQQGVDVFDLM